MRGTFDPRKIERKWQKVWGEEKLYRAQDFDQHPKQYILLEFPYPSGERLHVGHGRSYCCLDAVARLRRMQGYSVLFPIGWDAFGLPAENYALKTGIHPSITTKENIINAKKQAQSWGLSFDWEREINTTDPEYYRWTQWIFLQLYKKGLAYKAEVPVNWCPKDKTNLSDEEVVAGRCERCGNPVERRTQSQWLLKITAYADRLIDDLQSVDYREDIKQQQINWIGRSEGAIIKFEILNPKSETNSKSLEIRNSKLEIPVFTTRADTLFGVTFLVLSPEKAQDYLEEMPYPQREAVEKYLARALKKSELQRQEQLKEKTGVFTGLYVQHPLTEDKLPVWIADFVLSGYGTGVVMAVPAHDQRDFEFAKKYDLPLKEVIVDVQKSNFPKEAFEREGTLINSAQFDGLHSKEASDKVTQFLVEKKLGKKSIDYKLRDWVFSRQHYWGEPIPIIFCRRCWEETQEALTTQGRSKSKKSKVKMQEGYDYAKIDGKEYAIVTVSEEELPVELPYVENYKPTETGESPLASVPKWVEVRCPTCNSQARRETDTMPNWAGSSWYYLAYTFWHKLGIKKSDETPEALTAEGRSKSKKFKNVFLKYRKEIDYWMGQLEKDTGRAPRSPSRSRRGGGGVDWYNGGMEHTTLHLLYSRFWYKFLYDQKLVPSSEPYAKRTSHGVVLGPDGQKMSKSRGNVVNPDEVIDEFGADTFRMYEAFMGPFEQTIAWDPKGVLGVRRFLDKVWKAHQQVLANSKQQTANHRKPLVISHPLLVLQRSLHRLIKKVEEDTLSLKFNTAVAEMMKFINQAIAQLDGLNAPKPGGLSPEDWGVFLRVLAPYAPHLTEELYQSLEEIENKMKPHSRLNAHSAFPSVKSQKFGSIHQQPWPKYDPKLIAEETVTVVVQINGRLRGRMEVPAGTGEAEITEVARQAESVASRLHGRKVAKTIFIPDNLINFVTI